MAEVKAKEVKAKEVASKVPAVYGAMFKVLEAMSVEKNGTLPGNMGSGKYITAVDLSAEAKRQFVTNKLVILPHEKEVSKEIVINPKGQTIVTVSVEGTYTIVSTVDGSSAVIGGVGDGYATGTAVASNIASTNALKNALLRTFLVTEQSTEDAAKNGPAEPTETRAVSEAKRTAQNPGGDLNALRAELIGLVGDQATATKTGNDFFKVPAGEPALWSSDSAKIAALIAHIKKTGEV